MDRLSILGIDPGGNMGIAIYMLHPETLAIEYIEPMTIVLNKAVNDFSIDDMYAKVEYIDNIVSDLIYRYNVLAIGMESAFINPKFPQAIMSLSQYTGTIERTALRVRPLIKFFKFPPKAVKSNISMDGTADKDQVLRAVLKIKEIKKALPRYDLTEHESDATAIGYLVVQAIRDDIYILTRF